MKTAWAALILVLLAPQETPEKALERLMLYMDKGAFTEGRAAAAATDS